MSSREIESSRTKLKERNIVRSLLHLDRSEMVRRRGKLFFVRMNKLVWIQRKVLKVDLIDLKEA